MAYLDKADQVKSAHRHYERNKDKLKARAKKWTAQNRQTCREYIDAYLAIHPCATCGNNDRDVLEFDHTDRKLKSFNLADGYRGCYSFKRVIKEIEKCTVSCANCHRKKTRQLREYFKV